MIQTPKDEPAAACAQAPEPPKAVSAGTGAGRSALKRRLLLVDDQKMNLMVLKAMLSKIGDFEIVLAGDGREALDILTSPGEKPFDAVFTDMWMPEMDGEGLVKEIRAREEFKDLPVIVITADVEALKTYRRVGFTNLVLKPVTLDKLKEFV